jgi:hypothetical protein
MVENFVRQLKYDQTDLAHRLDGQTLARELEVSFEHINAQSWRCEVETPLD